MAKGETIKLAYARGSKVRNRHSSESAVIESITVNDAGNWYHMQTDRGMSLGIWHETDIDGAPKTVAPTEKRA
tara:strand:+ start:21896 stop:22114 length:219 start_codon:yes stop_codon:yes gene_type:complete